MSGLFDFALSRKARDAAMEQTEAAAAEKWKGEAWQLILRLSSDGGTFTTDDLWKHGLEMPKEPRALGPLMRRALGAKVCVKTGIYVASTRVVSHGRPKCQYRGTHAGCGGGE
jgi:hypothetical protein